MTPERSRQLNSAESGRLTHDEMREGWHFCHDWDTDAEFLAKWRAEIDAARQPSTDAEGGANG